jgi:hypothetical protein
MAVAPVSVLRSRKTSLTRMAGAWRFAVRRSAGLKYVQI